MSIIESKRRVAYINEMINSGRADELVRDGEAYHADQLASIAREICSREGVRVVLIAGPSSSGKTSAAQRLALELRTRAIEPIVLSLDNWFKDSRLIPLTKDGKKDQESVYAIDIELLKRDINDLIAGKEVAIPTFNFIKECREYLGRTLRLEQGKMMVIEGTHALNPVLTDTIASAHKYKIFAAPMSPLTMDGEHWVPTHIHRLIRRMSRDLRTRGKSPQQTIRNWPSVRAGEAQWIEPFRNEADSFFDTSTLYELPAMRRTIETALRTVPADAEEYTVAQELMKYIAFFEPIEPDRVPHDSILREFIGGSVFNVG